MSKVVMFDELGGPEVVRVAERTVEAPAAKEVQIEVRAAGLNRAELMFMAGEYLAQPALPSHLGVEAAGIVRAVGDGVTSVAVGDKISVFPTIDMTRYGTLGELANVPEWAITPKPPTVTFTEAAAFWMAYATAWGGLVQSGGLKQGAGQTVLISAASSSVGLASIDVAKAYGATVIATTRTQDKALALCDYGADHVVVTEREDLVDAVQSVTDGVGFHIALDPVGGSFVEALASAAAREAIIVEYSLLAGEPTPLPFFAMIGKGLSIKTFHLGFDLAQHGDRLRAAKDYLLPKFASGKFRSQIDRTFSLDQAPAAYQRLASNQQVGKVVIEVTP